MFRVQEDDGTFNVYDSSTGNLVMVVTKENKENGHSNSCASVSRADQKMVQLLSSVNYNATDVCRKKFLPVVTLQNINVCELMTKPPPPPIRVVDEPIEDSRSYTPTMASEVREPVQDAFASDDEYDCLDQDSFMSFFGLSSTKEANASVTSLEAYRKRISQAEILYPRGDLCDVDVSSNLGALMRSKTTTSCAPVESSRTLISRYEVYCQTENRRLGNWDVSSRKACSTNYAITYPVKRQGASHLYVFNRRQRLQQYRRLKTGLTKRSRQLAKLCMDCSVKLTRLTAKQIQNCCQNVRLEPVLVHSNEPSSSSPYSVRSFAVGDADLCIDGTIVIEIDEFGSETVTVSRKPSKMINQNTGNPWLSPRKVVLSGNSSSARFVRSVIKPSPVSLPVSFPVPRGRLLADISIVPLTASGDAATVLDNRPNDNSDSESDIEFLGSVVKTNAKTYPILTTLINAPVTNGDVPVCASGDSAFDPLAFVRTTYEDECTESICTSAAVPAASAVMVPRNPSPMTKVNLLRKPSRLPVHKVADVQHLSVDAILSGNVRVGALPRPRKSILPCPMKPMALYGQTKSIASCPTTKQILPPCASQGFSLSPVQLVVNNDDCVERSALRQAELLLISNLVRLGDTTVDALKPVQRNCALRCHICQVEERYEANAVGHIYDHMANHGGLSRASLVSSLENWSDEYVILLQALPLDTV